METWDMIHDRTWCVWRIKTAVSSWAIIVKRQPWKCGWRSSSRSRCMSWYQYQLNAERLLTNQSSFSHQLHQNYYETHFFSHRYICCLLVFRAWTANRVAQLRVCRQWMAFGFAKHRIFLDHSPRIPFREQLQRFLFTEPQLFTRIHIP